jgi:hypothetical protein
MPKLPPFPAHQIVRPSRLTRSINDANASVASPNEAARRPMRHSVDCTEALSSLIHKSHSFTDFSLESWPGLAARAIGPRHIRDRQSLQ